MSVGSSMVGSGTFSTRMSFAPCHVTAFMDPRCPRTRAGSPHPERVTSADLRRHPTCVEVRDEVVQVLVRPLPLRRPPAPRAAVAAGEHAVRRHAGSGGGLDVVDGVTDARRRCTSRPAGTAPRRTSSGSGLDSSASSAVVAVSAKPVGVEEVERVLGRARGCSSWPARPRAPGRGAPTSSSSAPASSRVSSMSSSYSFSHRSRTRVAVSASRPASAGAPAATQLVAAHADGSVRPATPARSTPTCSNGTRPARSAWW